MHPDIATAKANAAPSAEEIFLDDCRFAKVVRLGEDYALLIGRDVIHVSGPSAGGLCSVLEKSWAERLATALRKIDVRQTSGLQYGTLATEPPHQATADFVDDVRVQLDVSHVQPETGPIAQQVASALGKKPKTFAELFGEPSASQKLRVESLANINSGESLVDAIKRLEKRIEAVERQRGSVFVTTEPGGSVRV